MLYHLYSGASYPPAAVTLIMLPREYTFRKMAPCPVVMRSSLVNLQVFICTLLSEGFCISLWNYREPKQEVVHTYSYKYYMV